MGFLHESKCYSTDYNVTVSSQHLMQHCFDYMTSNHQGTSYSKQKLFSIKQSVSTWQRVLHFIVLICPLSLISITGCEANYEPWVIPDKVLVPLDVGNWWEYEVRVTGGPFYFRDTVFESVGVTVRGELIMTSAIATDNGSEPPFKWLYANGPGGLYIMGGVAPTDTFHTAIVKFRYPAKVGQKWMMPQLSFSRSKLEFYISDFLEVTLVDDDSVVVTPAGTFVCYVYRYVVDAGDDVVQDFVYFTYYSPSIGFIKQEERREDESLLNEMVLIRYNINGQNDHD